MSTLKMKELSEVQLVLSIWFKNLTSETIVESRIQMTSYYSNGCLLVMPAKVCVKGHQVLLRFSCGPHNGKTSPRKIELTGNVVEMVAVDEKFNEVNIQFSQYIKEEWQTLIDQFEVRQDEINSIIKKLKKIS